MDNQDKIHMLTNKLLANLGMKYNGETDTWALKSGVHQLLAEQAVTKTFESAIRWSTHSKEAKSHERDKILREAVRILEKLV